MQRCDLFQADVQRLTRVIRDATRRHGGVSLGDALSRSSEIPVYVPRRLDFWLSGKSRSSRSQDRTVQSTTRDSTADKSRSRVSSSDAETAQLRHNSDRPSGWRPSSHVAISDGSVTSGKYRSLGGVTLSPSSLVRCRKIGHSRSA
jgi:hypothetical protein